MKYDLWTAAYFGDVERLKSLLVVADPPAPEEDPSAEPEEIEAARTEHRKLVEENAQSLKDKLSSTGLVTINSKTALPVLYGMGFRLTVEDAQRHVVGFNVKLSRKAPHSPASPLHWAILGGNPDALALLVELGAPLDSPSCGKFELSPTGLCTANGMKNVLEFLQKVKVDFSERVEREAREAAEAESERKRAEEERKKREAEEREREERDENTDGVDVNPEGYEEVDVEGEDGDL